jgi:hypothetical protein
MQRILLILLLKQGKLRKTAFYVNLTKYEIK